MELERLEKQMYVCCPSLNANSAFKKESIRKKLHAQLYELEPVVSLEKFNVHSLLLNFKQNLQKCREFGIIPTTAEVGQVVEASQPSHSPEDDCKLNDRLPVMKRLTPLGDDTTLSDQEDNIPLAFREDIKFSGINRKRSLSTINCDDQRSHSALKRRRQSTACSMTLRRMSDNVKVFRNNSKDSAVTLTIPLPLIMAETEKMEFSFDCGNINVARQVLDSKLQSISNSDECKKKRASNTNHAAINIPKNSDDTANATQDDGTLSNLISEVLGETDDIETLLAVRSLENNGEINGGLDATVAPSTSKKKKKNVSFLPKSAPKKRGRKPKEQNNTNISRKKSDIAKYVELFSSSCDQLNAFTPATPTTISQIVTSTTQNCDQTQVAPANAAQIAYYINGEWVNAGYCQVIASDNVENITLNTCNQVQDNFSANTPFEDFVDYIDNSNNDNGNNVIARVLDGGNIATSNADNILVNRADIANHFIVPANAQIVNTIKTGNENGLAPDYNAKMSKIFIHEDGSLFYTNDGVLDLSTKSNYNPNPTLVVLAEENGNDNNCVPLDLSKKTTETQQMNGDDNHESDDMFLRRLLEDSDFDYKSYQCNNMYGSNESTDLLFESVVNANASFKAALDMPLLDNDDAFFVPNSSPTATNDKHQTSPKSSSNSKDGEPEIEDNLQNKIDDNFSTLSTLTISTTAEANDNLFTEESDKQSKNFLHESLDFLGDDYINNADNNIEIPSTMISILNPETMTNTDSFSSEKTVNQNIETFDIIDHKASEDNTNQNQNLVTNNGNCKQTSPVNSTTNTPAHSLYESVIPITYTNFPSGPFDDFESNEALNNSFLSEENAAKDNMNEYNSDQKCSQMLTRILDTNNRNEIEGDDGRTNNEYKNFIEGIDRTQEINIDQNDQSSIQEEQLTPIDFSKANTSIEDNDMNACDERAFNFESITLGTLTKAEIKGINIGNIKANDHLDLKETSLECNESKDEQPTTDPLNTSNIEGRGEDPYIISNFSLLDVENKYFDSGLDFDDDAISLATSCFNSPEDDRYFSSVVTDTCDNLCEMELNKCAQNNYNGNFPLDEATKPSEISEPRNEAHLHEKIELSIDNKCEKNARKFKIPKIVVTNNQLSEISDPSSKTKLAPASTANLSTVDQPRKALLISASGNSVTSDLVPEMTQSEPYYMDKAKNNLQNTTRLFGRLNSRDYIATQSKSPLLSSKTRNPVTFDFVPEVTECEFYDKDDAKNNPQNTSHLCERFNSRGQIAGRGGEAINVGTELIDIAKIFGPNCFPFLVDACFIPGSAQHDHQLRDPTLVQIALEALPSAEMSTAYKFMFNHSKLFKRYFFVFCNVYSKVNNRNKLLNMVYDCEKHIGCVFLLRNIFHSLVECGFSKVNACRQILRRSRCVSSYTIDVLVAIIFEADWVMFCDYLERFANFPHYSFRMNILNDMAARVLCTKDASHFALVCKCLFTLHQKELVQCSPNLIALLQLMKDGQLC